MAVPIFGPEQSVAAVVYLDSSERNFFGADLQEVVLAGCTGVASYINQVY